METKINAKDGTVLIKISAGNFQYGPNKILRHQPEYWMALHPTTNAQYRVFCAQTGHPEPLGGFKQDDHPVVGVNFYDAEAYAKWAGLELPTESQWEKAARGPDGNTYPWGNEWDETKCRNYNNKGADTTASVYDYPQGASFYGIQQMAGNVWEWCNEDDKT